MPQVSAPLLQNNTRT